MEAVLLSGGSKSIKTDICLGIETEYELTISASNANRYGNFMVASVGNQVVIGYVKNRRTICSVWLE